MKFSEWVLLKESEQVQQLPTPKDILYTCAVLERATQSNLIGYVRRWMFEASGHDIPKGWIGRCHHMTIKFKPKQADIMALANYFGKKIELTVTDFAFDDFGIALVVKPTIALQIGQQPHITVAHSPEVGAVYSNTLLADKSKWRPVHENLQIPALVVGIKSDNVSTWPDLPEPLAATSLSF